MSATLFARPEAGERALLLQVELQNEAKSAFLPEVLAREFRELAVSAGAEVIDLITCSRNYIDSKYFIGSGKVAEIADRVRAERIELLLVDHSLTPSQERNLERALKCRVLDRTGLILDIFATRARSFEGKLQVELAQLKHIATRLVRGWTHLERQKGGIGMRGPGESQLETDRRLLAKRIKLLGQRLEKVSQNRQQSRAKRKKSLVPTLALVGYTNAGKSSLFNALTAAHVYVQDQLFATLDPTLRQWQLANQQTVVLADTVGFIRQLPHDLVAAFRATLQETQEASLLLHVVDVSDSDAHARIDEVNSVLQMLGAENIPQLLVYNKIDLSENHPQSEIRYQDGKPVAVYLSVMTGAGLDLLDTAISALLADDAIGAYKLLALQLAPSDAKLRALLYSAGAIQSEVLREDGGFDISARLSPELIGRLGLDALLAH